MRLAVLLLVLLLMAGFHPTPQAAAPPHYVLDPSWPAPGTTAPAYGTNEVVGVAAGADQVFVLQRTFPAMLIFGKDGRFIRSWGDSLTLRHSCRLDPEGNLWLTGIYDHQVAKYTQDGQLLGIWGEKGVPGADDRHFNGPADVAFGRDGSVYIADGYGNSRVVHLAHDGTFLGQWGRAGKGWGEFNLVHSVATDPDGNVYVADRENRRVQVFTADGRFLHGWRTGWRPYSLYLNRDHQLCISSDRLFAVYTLAGRRLTVNPLPTVRIAHMISSDPDGSIFFTDLDGHRVVKYRRR